MEVLLNPVERNSFLLILSSYTNIHHVNLKTERKLDVCYL